MYPHERSLVEDLKDEKFTLLGINSDSTIAKAKSAFEREKIVWPVIFDNGGTSGPVASRWGVRGWPTIYVIDANGVIRFQNVRGEKMTEAVKQLLEEAKTAKR